MIEEYEKQCNKCLETKPLAAFYKRYGKGARCGDGLMRHCKKCQNQLIYANRKKQKSEHYQVNSRPTRATRPKIFAFHVDPIERSWIEDIARAWDCTPSDAVRQIVRQRAIHLGIIVDTQDGSIQFVADYQRS